MSEMTTSPTFTSTQDHDDRGWNLRIEESQCTPSILDSFRCLGSSGDDVFHSDRNLTKFVKSATCNLRLRTSQILLSLRLKLVRWDYPARRLDRPMKAKQQSATVT